MATTTEYGVNRNGRPSSFHENGMRAEPKLIWGKEDHAGMARAATRSISHLDIESLVRDYVDNNKGQLPTKLYTTAPKGSTRLIGQTYKGLGYVGLTIHYNHDSNFVAA